MATAPWLGLSTRRMEKLVETPGITGLSKSPVSVLTAEADTHPADLGPHRRMAEAIAAPLPRFPDDHALAVTHDT